MLAFGLLVAVLALGSPASGSGRHDSGAPSPAGHVDRHEAARQPRFDAEVFKLGRPQKRRMRGVSYHHGCPVPLRDLRLLRLDHWGFDGDVHRGRLVIHRTKARAILDVMREAFRARFAIRRMELIDHYGGDDRRSMDADNTSAFNCREVAGRPGVWSQHAYGRAIDVNPIENPFVTSSGYVSPPAGQPYADRSPTRKGMVTRRIIRSFGDAGWEWGGRWSPTKDYQHFSSNGR
ncbi:MAG: M15 family metallopeptidase [Solirubrobacterales bacterium]|nr:M15 family metallopeptidase [Solirubrobacterales bacterium]